MFTGVARMRYILALSVPHAISEYHIRDIAYKLLLEFNRQIL